MFIVADKVSLTGSDDGIYGLEDLPSIADIDDSESSEGDDMLWTSGTESMLSMMSPGVEIRRKKKPSVCRCKGTVCHCCGSDAGILRKLLEELCLTYMTFI